MAERIKSTNQRQRDQLEDSLTELEAGLRIDKNGLDEALEQQPELYYRVSKKLVEETSQRDALKQEFEELEAETDEKVRMQFERDKVKATETEVKMVSRLDPKIKGLKQDMLRANRRVADLQALEKSFSQRSYAMKELVSLYVANYYGDHVGGGRQYADMKNQDAEEVRRKQAEQRRERNRRDD